MTESEASISPGGQLRPLYSPLVEKALRVAADAHRDQTRKALVLPYFQHPASVVLILARCGYDSDELLAAAVLHDTIEDTNCTVESLMNDFPEAVVTLVQECTENKTDDSGANIPWRLRKESHITLMKDASTAGRAIVLADKLHNLGSMVYDLERGDELWSRFSASPDDVIWYHREIVAAAVNVAAADRASMIAHKLDRLAAECLCLIDQLVDSIPK
jgi:(p)ppGpp synthase/HD superfamily hydrolase